MILWWNTTLYIVSTLPWRLFSFSCQPPPLGVSGQEVCQGTPICTLLCKQAGKGGWVVAGLTFKNHGKALDVSVQGVAAWYVQGAQKYLF